MDSMKPCPSPLSLQFADIANLEDGWADGDGHRYPPQLVRRALGVFVKLLDFGGIDMPYLYPSEDGTIRAEWNHPARDVVLTLDSTVSEFRLLCVDPSSTDPSREVFGVDDGSLKALAGKLKQLLLIEQS